MDAQPEEAKIACPHCGQHLVVDKSALGTELECPTCTQSFLAAEAEGETDAEGGGDEDSLAKGGDFKNEVSESVKSDEPTTSTTEESASVGAVETLEETESDDHPPETHRPFSFREKGVRCWTVARTVLVAGLDRVKRGFLRLPERAQGAVLTAVVFLVGIAAFSGNGAPRNTQPTPSEESPPSTVSEPVHRPDIKPLSTDPRARQWIRSCIEGDYTEVMRFPKQNEGKPMYIQGRISHVYQTTNHRGGVEIEQDGDWKREWIVVFDDEHTLLPAGNLLKDDEVCVFGTFEKIKEWTGKNAFNATISGKNPRILARLISEDDPDDVMEAYEEEEENEIEAKDSDDGRESTAKGDAPKKRAQSGDFWKTDSRKTNGMYPGFFPAYAGSIHADDLKTQFDFWYDGDALSVRNDPDGKKILWIEMYDSASASGGTTVFLKVAGAKNIIAFHAALEKAFAECDGKKKPGDVLMSGVEFPSCMVYGYETSRGNRGYQGGATCAETAFGVLPEGRMFLKTTVFEPSAMKPSWWPRGKWKIDPYIVLPTAEQAKSGGEPVGKILTLTDFSYLEKCWQESKK